MPSSSHSGSIAASRTIAASCAAVATSITRCNDPTADAHSARDPATADGLSTAANAANRGIRSLPPPPRTTTRPPPGATTAPTPFTPLLPARSATPNLAATTDRPPAYSPNPAAPQPH